MTEFEYQRRQYVFEDNFDWQGDRWVKGVNHRDMVMRILTNDSHHSGKLAILGAGPCMDLDLERLRKRFDEVHLFDLDGEVVWRGVDYQQKTGDAGVFVHGQVDVTGHYHQVAELARDPNNQAKVDQLVQSLNKFRLEQWAGHFDVVVSTCLLSQILEHAVHAMGEDHVRLIEVLTMLRLSHVVVMADMCKPGGCGNLIFDFVSSQTLPGMIGTSGEALIALLENAVQSNNFFHGLNPQRVNEVLLRDPRLQPLIQNVRMTKPWVWNAVEVCYAVLTAQFTRK